MIRRLHELGVHGFSALESVGFGLASSCGLPECSSASVAPMPKISRSRQMARSKCAPISGAASHRSSSPKASSMSDRADAPSALTRSDAAFPIVRLTEWPAQRPSARLTANRKTRDRLSPEPLMIFSSLFLMIQADRTRASTDGAISSAATFVCMFNRSTQIRYSLPQRPGPPNYSRPPSL